MANKGVAGTTRCRAGRQDAASRQASSRLLRCAPALRVTRPNVLTHRVFMAGSELPATSRPICENTSSPEVNPHILCSPFIRGFSQPPTTISASSPHASRICSTLSEDRAICRPRCSTGISTLVRRSSICWRAQPGSINKSRWTPSLAVSATPREESRSVFQTRGGPLQLGNARGRVVIGDRRGIEARGANCFHPLGPIRVRLIGLGLEVMRRRGVRMKIDAPPSGTGPIPRCAHAAPPIAPSTSVYAALIAATRFAPTTPRSRS